MKEEIYFRNTWNDYFKMHNGSYFNIDKRSYFKIDKTFNFKDATVVFEFQNIQKNVQFFFKLL